MKLAAMISSLCKEQGLSLNELSRRSNVPVQTIHNWTAGGKAVNPDQVRKVAIALSTSVHFLLFGESDPNDPAPAEVLQEIFSGDVRVTLHRIRRKQGESK